jgi:predicted O-methyltransferase YrrM
MMELGKDLEKYILDHIDKEDSVLTELYRETYLRALQPRMVSGHLQGLILSMFSKMLAPMNILEIGTFTGYSAICLAKGLKSGGLIYTIEIDDELRPFASEYFLKSGISESVVQITGNALKVIPSLEVNFDLVFIDGDKTDYPGYYNLAFEKVVSGGYIIADNTLWGGKVVRTLALNDEQTRGIIEFNKLISNDTRIEKVILPFRDGMTVIRKK